MESTRKAQDFIATGKSSYPEVEHIRGDLRALGKDTAELGRHVVADGREKVNELADTASQLAKDEYKHLSAATREKSQAIESFIKQNPFQGVAAGFLIGFVASMWMRKH